MIDVIIPAYNAKLWIEKALCSIAYQDLAYKVNVYLVNDASDEDYHDIINFFKHFMNIKELTLEENKGPGMARQYGIDNSNGEYIIFVDSDDTLSCPFSLKKLYDEIKFDDVDMVIASFVEEMNNDFIEHINDNNFLHGKMYKRSFLEENDIHFSDIRFHEDCGFNQLVMLCKPRIRYISDKVYIWHNNQSSIMRVNNYENIYKHLDCFAQNVNYAIEEGLKRHGDRKAISELAFSSLALSYYYYLEFYEKEEVVKNMIKYLGKTLKWYLEDELEEEKKLDIMEMQFNRLFSTTNRKYLLNPIISFDMFLDKIKETGGLC